MQEPEQGAESQSDKDRRTGNIVLLLFLVVLIGGGIWLINAMILFDDMTLDKMSQGQQVQVSLVAVNGQGHRSNEPSLTFTLHLGGP